MIESFLINCKGEGRESLIEINDRLSMAIIGNFGGMEESERG